MTFICYLSYTFYLYKKYIMEREIVLKVGEPFELEKFQKSVKNIFRLGYFKSINQEEVDYAYRIDSGSKNNR